MCSATVSGKAVVITGAGQGIGAAYAAFLARHGARVLVNDIDPDAAGSVAEAIVRAGGTAAAHPGSVTDPDLAEELVAGCVARWGRLDGLVNNAGVFHVNAFVDEDAAALRGLVEVNVLGTAYCARSALRRMCAQGSGSLVNVTSGAQSGTPGLAAYGASKGAVASLTYALALEVAGTGVRVNAVSPNAQTRMARTYESWLGREGHGPNSGKAPEANAPIVAYLLSDAAASVNGQVVRMDGAEVALVGHPRRLDPVLRLESGDLDEVARGFAGTLAPHTQPLGLFPKSD